MAEAVYLELMFIVKHCYLCICRNVAAGQRGGGAVLVYNSSLYAENTTFSQNAATAANLYNISIPAPAKNSDDALPGMTWCGTVGGVLPQDEIYGLTSPAVPDGLVSP